MILLQADVLELKANPKRRARGTIIEAKLDRGRGPVATVLVQEGTLKVGDPFVCGTRVRPHPRHDRRQGAAGSRRPARRRRSRSSVSPACRRPATSFVAVADEAKARQVAEHRRGKQREAELAKTSQGLARGSLPADPEPASVKELKVVVKADVQGSVEAIRDALAPALDRRGAPRT